MGPAIIFIVIVCGLWLWSLISCITNKRLSDSNRIIAVILIVVLGLIGSLVYLFLPRESTQRNYGRKLTSRNGRTRGTSGTRGIKRSTGGRNTGTRSVATRSTSYRG